MSLPGFSGEISLERTRGHYVIADSIVRSEGVVLPSSTYCGKCYKSGGACVQDCKVTIPPTCHRIGGLEHCLPPVNGSVTNPCPLIECYKEPQCCPTGCVNCS
jgi:hypothetical protein